MSGLSPSVQFVAVLLVTHRPSNPPGPLLPCGASLALSLSSSLLHSLLHIDLNSFVSYWSATPLSAAVNKHKHTVHRCCVLLKQHTHRQKRLKALFFCRDGTRGEFMEVLKYQQANDIQTNLDSVLIQHLRSEVWEWSGEFGAGTITSAGYISDLLSCIWSDFCKQELTSEASCMYTSACAAGMRLIWCVLLKTPHQHMKNIINKVIFS